MRSLLAIASIHEFPIISIDLLIYFTQYDLDVDFFMDIHLVMGIDVNIGEWVLKLNKPLYEIKQEIAKWFDHLKTGLESRGCHQSQVDPYVCYRKDSVILTYVYDCVIISHKQDTITSLI